MNWHWLFEILEMELSCERIVLANPFKTRIIAEAQIKTDKVDARILADLLRGKLVSSVHIPGRETRRIKEVLRQRCFFVRQRTMLRNRIHRLLGGQHEVKLPQCSDLFGRKGLGFLERLELPAPTRLLLTQQLTLLKELAARIREDQKALDGLLEQSPALQHVRSLPGMGPILAAVVVTEIDSSSAFPRLRSSAATPVCVLPPAAVGSKTFQGKLLPHCNKWLRWAFVEAAWVAIGCSAYFGDFYKRKRALGKKPNIAILATARLMARITWQLLTQRRAYTSVAETQYLRSQPAERIACAIGLAHRRGG
jgi:transposase